MLQGQLGHGDVKDSLVPMYVAHVAHYLKSQALNALLFLCMSLIALLNRLVPLPGSSSWAVEAEAEHEFKICQLAAGSHGTQYRSR